MAVLVVTILGLVLAPTSAMAAVSVSKASLSSSGDLSVEGRGAVSRSTVVVTSPESRASSTADSEGRFKVRSTGFRSSTCSARVTDGSTSVDVTLTGCTPSRVGVITPDVAEIGPGFVGADFTDFSTTTTTMTLGPDALGPVRFEIVSGALPAGLALVDPNAGFTPAKSVHASIDGTPTTVQSSTFTVRATDQNGLTATRTYTIRINAPRTLEIVPQTDPPALVVGTSSTWWIEGRGGVKPYLWAVAGGQLPPGMSLVQETPDSYLVRVAGTPTTAGTFTFTLRLTDAQGVAVSRTLTMTVAAADTSTGPGAPALLAPADGASVTTPVTIEWTQEFDPSLSPNGGYNWQVSTSSTFSTLAASDSTLPTQTQDTVSGIPAGTYLWRVQAVDGQLRSSAWSAPRSFTVTGATAQQPGTATLRLPSYGSSFHPFESFRLFWTAAERAVRYELLASKDSTFQTGLIKVDNITGTSTGLTIGDFCNGCEQGTYSARVVAIDGDGNRGLPSNTVTFTISYNAPLPPPPGAVAPADGATVTLPVTLDWTDVPNPQDTGYEVEISRDSSFTDIEDHIPQITPSERTVLSLTSGTKFWRVRSHQGNASPTTSAVTAWSTPRSFVVPSAPPAVQSVWLGAPPCSDPCPGADSLVSGQEITGSLQLTSAAPAGGAAVSLTSSPSTGATHPTSVTVPAGTAFTTFRLFAGEVTQPTQVTLTATLGSSSDTFVFTVHPTTVKRLSFCCDSTGGLPAAAHLDLTGKAPAGGAVVTLASSSPLAQPPATVSVPAGSFSTPISIPTSEVTQTTTVTISATMNGTTVSAPLKLYPQQPPTSLVLDRTSTNGQEGATGTVRIAEGQPHEVLMRITSSHPDIAKPPPYAQIGYLGVAGSFSIATQAPAASTEVTISATGAGVTLTRTLVVHPVGGPGAGASISSLALSPTTVTGGSQGSTGTVTLSAAAPSGGASVALSSGNTAAATVPASVTVPAGATSATFTVSSRSVTASTDVNITGVYGGVARGAVLTVSPAPAAPAASAVSLSPTSVTGGGSSTGTVTLTAAAPSGGAVVALSSSAAPASVPASVTVPAGATSATFTVTTSTVTAPTSVTISGAYGGATRTATLTVNPPASSSAALTVTATGRSGERITSSPAGINVSVGSTGSASFPSGTSVTLSATNGRDVVWSGACSSGGAKTRSCTFTLTAAASVTANVQ